MTPFQFLYYSCIFLSYLYFVGAVITTVWQGRNEENVIRDAFLGSIALGVLALVMKGLI